MGATEIKIARFEIFCLIIVTYPGQLESNTISPWNNLFSSNALDMLPNKTSSFIFLHTIPQHKPWQKTQLRFAQSIQGQ